MKYEKSTELKLIDSYSNLHYRIYKEIVRILKDKDGKRIEFAENRTFPVYYVEPQFNPEKLRMITAKNISLRSKYLLINNNEYEHITIDSLINIVTRIL